MAESAHPDSRVPGYPFQGMRVVFVETGVLKGRLEVWRRKLQQKGGTVFSFPDADATHVFAQDWIHFSTWLKKHNTKFKNARALQYEWLERCLQQGERVPEDPFILQDPHTNGKRKAEATCGTPGRDQGKDDDGVRPTAQGKANKGARTDGKRADAEDAGVAGGGKVLSAEEKAFWWREIHEGAQWGLTEKELLGKKRGRIDHNLEQHISSSEAKGGQHHTAGDASSKGQSARDPESGRLSAHVSLCPESGTPAENLEAGGDQKGLYCPPDLNKHITDPFKQLRQIYKEGLGDEWRQFSYYKALSVLEKVPERITALEQAKDLPNVGPSLQEKIREILGTGKIQKLENLKKDEMVQTLSLFGSIWGVGPKAARRLYDLGHRQLADLEKEPSLTPPQRLSLQFHDEINTRIARADVAAMEALVKREAEAVCPGVSILCGGSYRRGRATVGDMDFVATHSDGKSHVGFCAKLVATLKEMGFITHDLTVGYHQPGQPHKHPEQDKDRVDTFFGLCIRREGAIHHRIDIKVYPIKQYPFGLVAWTGNDVLNRRLRYLADTKGFRMDDHGIVVVDSKDKNSTTLPSDFGCKSEADIFKFFGCPYLEPWRRNL